MKHIPTDLLLSFITVVERGGFSQAGAVLGRSQPAMSLQLKRLEALTGVELLKRTSRTLELTEMGRIVADYGREILKLNQELLHHLDQTKLKGCVRLGFPNEFAISYLPEVLAAFSKRYPDVHLEVVSDLSRNLLDQQTVLKLDLILALSLKQQDSNPMLWSEDIVWVAKKGGLAADSKPLSLVVAPHGCVYRSRILTTLNTAKKRWRITYTGSSYGGIRAAVMAGLGVTAMARSTVPEGLQLISYNPQLPKLERVTVSLIHRSEHPNELVQRLAEHIKTRVGHVDEH